MSFGKRKDGRFYSKTKSSSISKSGSIQSSGIVQRGRFVKTPDKSDEAIQYVHKNYEKIMSKTAKEKYATYNAGNISKIAKSVGGTVHLTRVEATCGATSFAIMKLLNRNFGKGFAKEIVGYYAGDDRIHSQGYNAIDDEVKHEWVLLPDGTIIDNSCGQFTQNNLKTRLGKEQRLRIIRPDDPRHKYYLSEKQCADCGSNMTSISPVCKTCIDLKNIINLVEQTPEFKSGMQIADVTDLYREQGRGKEVGLKY